VEEKHEAVKMEERSLSPPKQVKTELPESDDDDKPLVRIFDLLIDLETILLEIRIMLKKGGLF